MSDDLKIDASSGNTNVYNVIPNEEKIAPQATIEEVMDGIEDDFQLAVKNGGAFTDDQLINLIKDALQLNLNAEDKTAFVKKLISDAKAKSFLTSPEAQASLTDAIENADVGRKELLNALDVSSNVRMSAAMSVDAQAKADEILQSMKNEDKMSFSEYEANWKALADLFAPDSIPADYVKQFSEIILKLGYVSEKISKDLIDKMDDFLNSSAYSDEQKADVVNTKIDFIERLFRTSISSDYDDYLISQYESTYAYIKGTSIDFDTKIESLEKLGSLIADHLGQLVELEKWSEGLKINKGSLKKERSEYIKRLQSLQKEMVTDRINLSNNLTLDELIKFYDYLKSSNPSPEERLEIDKVMIDRLDALASSSAEAEKLRQEIVSDLLSLPSTSETTELIKNQIDKLGIDSLNALYDDFKNSNPSTDRRLEIDKIMINRLDALGSAAGVEKLRQKIASDLLSLPSTSETNELLKNQINQLGIDSLSALYDDFKKSNPSSGKILELDKLLMNRLDALGSSTAVDALRGKIILDLFALPSSSETTELLNSQISRLSINALIAMYDDLKNRNLSPEKRLEIDKIIIDRLTALGPVQGSANLRQKIILDLLSLPSTSETTELLKGQINQLDAETLTSIYNTFKNSNPSADRQIEIDKLILSRLDALGSAGVVQSLRQKIILDLLALPSTSETSTLLKNQINQLGADSLKALYEAFKKTNPSKERNFEISGLILSRLDALISSSSSSEAIALRKTMMTDLTTMPEDATFDDFVYRQDDLRKLPISKATKDELVKIFREAALKASFSSQYSTQDRANLRALSEGIEFM